MLKIIRLFLLLLICCCLTACSSFSIASFFTMVFTGKGFGDHALSTVTGQECAFFNLVHGEEVCINDDSAEMILLTSDQFIDDSLMIAQE